MYDPKVRYRHGMLFGFNPGKNASKTCDGLCSAYGENAVSLSVCYKWFSKFRSGNFSIKDAPHSGRPTVIENDQLKQIVDRNPQFTTKEIADTVNVSKLETPDLAPSDFYLFRSLLNFLDGKNLSGIEDMKLNPLQYFAQKGETFLSREF